VPKENSGEGHPRRADRKRIGTKGGSQKKTWGETKGFGKGRRKGRSEESPRKNYTEEKKRKNS